MTIEEKAKAYDEALELARDYYKANLKLNNADENLLLEDIFPELRGDEDEKIRKEIIDYFISDDKYSVIKSPKYKELVALFEKQKDINSKEYVFRPLAGCDIESAAIQAVEQQKLGKKIVLAFNGAYIPVEEKTADNIVNEYYSWLEKQGKSSDQIHYWTEEEIEPIISDYLRGVEHYGGMIGRLRCLKPKSLEKQGGNPASININKMVMEYSQTKDGDFGLPVNCQIRAYRQGLTDAISTLNFEKQGNSSVKWQKNTPDNKPAVNHSILMKTIQGIAEGEWQGEYWFQYKWSWTLKDSDVLAWMELSNLDEQGEQKPAVVDFNAKDWYVSKVDGKIHDMTYNPADKVEPKFKVGDWIVNDYCMGRVVEITNDAYLLDIGQGIPFSCEHNTHLWTIQDAKDGDVLVGNKGEVILMFRGIGNTEWDDVIDYHCYYDCCHENFVVQKSVEYWGNTENNQLKPATKKQRDTLFAKMKEAGYEWDAEKKELKKIEQKDFAPKEDIDGEEKSKLTPFDKKVRDFLFSFYREASDGISLNEMIDGANKLNTMLGNVEKNLTWSEEDDYNLQCMIAKVTSDIQKGNVGRNNELIDWLKSLKDR